MTQPLYFKLGSDLEKLAAEAGQKLPEDETKWSQAITDYIASEVPELAKYPTEVVLDEKDEKMGYAKGRVKIKNNAVAPLIIRDYRLMPIDVFIVEDRFVPLNEKNLDQHLSSKDLADKTVTKKEIGNIENNSLQSGNRPPYSAYTHRNQGYKASSALKKLTGISEEDLANFKDRLEEDLNLSYKFASKSYDVLDQLTKLAEPKEESPIGLEDQMAQIREVAKRQEWPVNVIHMHKTASGEVRVRSSHDICPMAYNEQTITMEKAAKLFGANTMKKLASGEVVSTVKGRSGSTINLRKDIAFPTEEIEKFGHYDVVSRNDQVIRGFVIPEVYDYSMSKMAGVKLFTNPDVYAMQEKIAGRKVMAGPKPELPSSQIRHGTTGTFCFRYGEKTAALRPFTVTSFPLTSGEQVEFEAASNNGEALHFTVMPGLAAASPGEKRGHYLIPSMWQFVQIGNYQEPIYGSASEMQKTAAADIDDKGIKLMWDGVYFQMKGCQLENISQQVQDLDPMKARFLLTAFGVPPDYADKLLNRAKKDGVSEFSADVRPTGQYQVRTNKLEHRDGSMDTKYASSKIAEEVIRNAREHDWVKCAAEAEEKETVDTVLSLNFINSENLGEFVESIEELSDAQTKLAKLLVATRLGIKQVDAKTVKTAMDNLGYVIDDLEVMRSVMQERKKQRE